jgi:chromatin structure-remodeling complex subunit RSC9
MSNQRWDKFKFEGFPLLAETLMERALEITLLCTGVKWELEYDFRKPMDRVNVLNSLHGTPDILDRINRIPVTLPDDSLETEDFSHHLRNIKEATLILRNMCILPENAFYVSRYATGLLRDFLAIMLNIPSRPRLNELKNDALDIAEEVTRFLPTHPNDPLCVSLYRCLESPDRAHITRALFALAHFSTDTEYPSRNHAMERVSHHSLVQLFSFTLLKEDTETLSGAMDFWYQFTLLPENVERLIDVVNIPRVFVPRLVDLLSYEARPVREETVLQEEKIAPAPSEIPRVPPELLKELMELSEPERSSRWLRCCFVEDAECEITQIALWQGYQSRFVNPQQPGTGVLPAAEFIKNVSTTFTNAMAQVVTGAGSTTKFIIKGIRPLETALTFDGWPYLYCKWQIGDGHSKNCDRAFATPNDLRSHVFEDHMGLKPLDQPGHYNVEKADESIHTCRWDNCTRFKSVGPSADTAMVAEHVGSHLPRDRPADARPPSFRRKVIQPRSVREWYYEDTPLNHYGEPVGVAYKAALVMRNLAWNLPNADVEQYGNVSWKTAAFLNHRAAIVAAWDINRTLRMALTELIMLIDKDDRAA